MEEENIDVAFLSETWEREYKPLTEILQIPSHTRLGNVYQRKGAGGRTALVINHDKYNITKPVESHVTVPWGVEVTTAMIAPKQTTSDSLVKRILIMSIYSKPNSRKKTALLDFIPDVFNSMNRKYPDGTYWIIAGDANDLKLDAILNLSPHMKQVVVTPTRLDPPRLLDPIMTTMSKFYQTPICQKPLDADIGTGGAPSDHLCVKFSPVNIVNNKPARQKRKVSVRPMPDSKYHKYENWLKQQTWEDVTNAENVHEKAKILQNMSLEAMDRFFPVKEVVFTSDDQPWINSRIKTEIRKRKRIYSRHRKSEAWFKQNKLVSTLVKSAKNIFYKKQIEDCKTARNGQWYAKLKRMCKYNQHEAEQVEIEEIANNTHEEQANMILDSILKVNNSYVPIKISEIQFPDIEEDSIPFLSERHVESHILKIKTKPSTPPGDIPAIIVKKFSKYFCVPLTHILNACLKRGEWPDIWKIEAITPIPKVTPPKKMDKMRPISGLKLFNKIAEKIFSDMMLEDMKAKIYPAQFGNQKGLSTQHYLIKMIHKIVSSLDNNSKGDVFAVIASLIDGKQAFSHQDPTLGIKSFFSKWSETSIVTNVSKLFSRKKGICEMERHILRHKGYSWWWTSRGLLWTH